MLIILLFELCQSLLCTWSNAGTNTVGLIGQLTVQLTTASTANFVSITSSLTWSSDTATTIQSGSFACSNTGIGCITTSQTSKCSVTSNTVTNILCSGINNPAYTANQGTFTLTQLDSLSSAIDSCTTSTISFLPNLLNVVGSPTYTNPLNGNVANPAFNEETQFYIQIQTSSKLLRNDVIQFSFVRWTFSSTTSPQCSYNGGPFSFTYTYGTSLLVTLQNPLSLNPGSVIGCFFNIKTASVSAAHTINIQAYRGTSTQILDQISSLVSYIPPSGLLTVLSITPASYQVNVATVYKIIFTITNVLTQTSQILIQIPARLSYTAGGTCQVESTQLITGTCQSVSGNIKISNCFPSTGAAAGATITVNVQFTNVLVKDQTADFPLIQTSDSSGNVIDSGIGLIVSGYTSATITITVSTGSQQVGIYSDITFTLSLLNSIPAGAYMTIGVPTVLQAPTQCLVNNVIQSCSFASPKITQLFPNTIAAQTTTITLKGAFRNPYTFQPTASNGFSLVLYASNQVQLDGNTAFGQVTMTATSLMTIQVTRDNQQNGVAAQYSFQLTFTTDQIVNTVATISLPDFSLGTINCTPNTISCSKFSTSLTMNIGAQSAGSITIIVTGITNPDSLKPASITASTASNSFAISATTSAFIITDQLTNLITVTSMTQSVGQLGQLDAYTITVVLSNPITSGCTIQVIVPNGITFTTCTVNGYICSSVGQTITLTPNAFTLGTYTFTLNNLMNPTSYSDLYFQVSTFRSTFPMDITTLNDPKLQFKLTCALPCKTCTGSTCLTCYSSAINNLNNLSSGNCIETCPSQFYSNNFVCTACTSNCQICTSAGCTQCVSVNYTVQNGLCAIVCAAGQFGQNNTCVTCDPNCLTCQISATNCTTCSIGFLYQSKCVTSCPSPLFQVNQSCVACTSPCQTCTTGPTLCKDCISGTYQLGTNCLANCGNGYYISSTTCAQCVTPCVNCTSETACTSCIANKYLFQQGCINKCADQYYAASNNACQLCVSPCLTCSSATNCLSCISNLILYNSACVSSCPANSYSSNQSCIACDSSCSTCSSIGCVTCPSQKLLQSGLCVAQCSSNYYLSGTSCIACDTTCQTCNASGCITCASYKQLSKCVSQCSSNYYLNGSNCTQCASTCSTCNSAGCLTCPSNLLQMGSTCLSTCPANYTAVNNTCTLQNNTNQTNNNTNNNTNNTVSDNIQSNKYVPVPFTIGFLIVSLSVLVAKIQKSETFIPGALVGLGGVMVVASWATLGALYGLLDYQLYILLVAALGLLFLNLANLLLIKEAYHDIEFQKWLMASKQNKCAFATLSSISLISFTTSRLLFSRYFGFKFFKARLSSVELMRPLNIINGIMIIICVPACISSVIIAYQDIAHQQLFISAIDAFIVTVLLVIGLLWEIQKDETYFDEINYHSVRSHSIFNQTFQKFQFDHQQENDLHEHEPSIPKVIEEEEIEGAAESIAPIDQSQEFAMSEDPESSQHTVKGNQNVFLKQDTYMGQKQPILHEESLLRRVENHDQFSQTQQKFYSNLTQTENLQILQSQLNQADQEVQVNTGSESKRLSKSQERQLNTSPDNNLNNFGDKSHQFQKQSQLQQHRDLIPNQNGTHDNSDRNIAHFENKSQYLSQQQLSPEQLQNADNINNVNSADKQVQGINNNDLSETNQNYLVGQIPSDQNRNHQKTLEEQRNSPNRINQSDSANIQQLQEQSQITSKQQADQNEDFMIFDQLQSPNQLKSPDQQQSPKDELDIIGQNKIFNNQINDTNKKEDMKLNLQNIDRIDKSALFKQIGSREIDQLFDISEVRHNMIMDGEFKDNHQNDSLSQQASLKELAQVISQGGHSLHIQQGADTTTVRNDVIYCPDAIDEDQSNNTWNNENFRFNQPVEQINLKIEDEGWEQSQQIRFNDEDWGENQISPSDFNEKNQRFEFDIPQPRMAQTGQNFRTKNKIPRQMTNQNDTDPDDYEQQQQPMFEQFHRNYPSKSMQQKANTTRSKLTNKPVSTNKDTDKIYLQRLNTRKRQF